MKYNVTIYKQGSVVYRDSNLDGYNWKAATKKYDGIVESYVNNGYECVKSVRDGNVGYDVLIDNDGYQSVMMKYEYECIIDELVDCDGKHIIRDVLYTSSDGHKYLFSLAKPFMKSGMNNLLFKRVDLFQECTVVFINEEIVSDCVVEQKFIDGLKLHLYKKR